uniref:RWP-RK domain-containing protein n=1 Tax=Panagrellus redivivus TaxID=6233 RepID=A0A7E4WAY0_PANRE
MQLLTLNRMEAKCVDLHPERCIILEYALQERFSHICYWPYGTRGGVGSHDDDISQLATTFDKIHNPQLHYLLDAVRR